MMMPVAILIAAAAGALVILRAGWRAWRRRPPRIRPRGDDAGGRIRIRFYRVNHGLLIQDRRQDRAQTRARRARRAARRATAVVADIRPHLRPFILLFAGLWAVMLALNWSMNAAIMTALHPGDDHRAMALVMGTAVAGITAASAFALTGLLKERLFADLSTKLRRTLIGLATTTLVVTAGVTVVLAPLRSQVEYAAMIAADRNDLAAIRVEEPEQLPIYERKLADDQANLQSARLVDRLMAILIIVAELLLVQFALAGAALLLAFGRRLAARRRSHLSAEATLDRNLVSNRMLAPLAGELEARGLDPATLPEYLPQGTRTLPASPPAPPPAPRPAPVTAPPQPPVSPPLDRVPARPVLPQAPVPALDPDPPGAWHEH